MNPVSALAQAIELGGQGYSCFPCREDKRPSCLHGCNDATTNDEDLKALWSEFPGPLIGVATGPPSQICVVDIDKKPEALEWWQQHKSRLLPTRAHRTRSGGIHLLFSNYDGLRNSASKIAKGIDVRGNGGYIIWWPAAGCPVLSDAPIARWPDWLEWLVEPPAPATPIYRAPLYRVHDGQRQARLDAIIATVAQAPEGQRNNVVFWAVCRLYEMIFDQDLNQSDCTAALKAIEMAARHAGLGDQEINRTIMSAIRRRA
jgi:hypothetical protein